MGSDVRTERYPTPYNDAYPTCERTCVELRIYLPEHLDPAAVTERLGITPSDAHREGDWLPGRVGAGRRASRSLWTLSSEGSCASLDMRRHLDWVIEHIGDKSEALTELQQVDGVSMHLHCIWWAAQDHSGPTIWPVHMRAVAELNLECQLELAFYGDDDRG